MKYQNSIVIISIAAVLLFVGLFALGAIPLAVETIEQSDFYMRPTFAYLKCEAIAYDTVKRMMTGEFSQTDITNYGTPTKYDCQDFIGINEGCDISLRITDGSLPTFATHQVLMYQVVPKGTPFAANNANYFKCNFAGVGECAGGYDTNDILNIGHLGADQDLFIIFKEVSFLTTTHKKVDNKIEFIVGGNKFGIIDTSTYSARVGQLIDENTLGNCLLTDDAYKNREFSTDMADFGLKSQELDWENLNQAHRVYSYLSGYVAAPYIWGNGIQDYNGNAAYCEFSTNTLYRIVDVTTEDGRKYPTILMDSSNIVGTVSTCCEGEKQPGKICQQNKWVDIENQECNLAQGILCSESVWQPYTTKLINRYNCVNNECILETRQVECNYPSDCPNGQVCVIEADMTQNHCEEGGTGDICGDKICTAKEEKSGSCNSDCNIPPPPEKNWFLYIIIGLLILILLIVLASVMIKKKRK